MSIFNFIKYIEAILELVFFVLTVYHLVKGLRTKNYSNLKKYGIIYLILNFIRRVSEYAQNKLAAVSIIGGADGPTSIFLAGKVGAGFFFGSYLIWLLVILALVGIVIYIRKKK